MWSDVGALEDIPRLGARVVKSARGDVALFRTAQDEVFALVDKCPHKAGPLSQGIVHGTSVACPLHDWKICLKSGHALGGDEGATPTLSVRVADGRIELDLASISQVAA
jgi:nitrite reductase (NADH) small subunit